MQPIKPFLNTSFPLNIAHRGGMGLAPENTLRAFEIALAQGSHVFELDIHTTADREIVVIHDDTVNRTTNGSGKISLLTLAEVKKLDAGQGFTPDNGASYPFRGQGITIPTLREVFQAFPEYRINIELKGMVPGFEHKLLKLINECSMEHKLLIAAENHTYAQVFRPLAPQLPYSASKKEVTWFFTALLLRISFLSNPGIDAFQVPEFYGKLHIVTPRFIDAAHKKNIKVHVWTINDEADMERLLRWGVDGIVTDYPNRLQRVIKKVSGQGILS
jgi:glycerophosphoryl diester phosphodiesterase